MPLNRTTDGHIDCLAAPAVGVGKIVMKGAWCVNHFHRIVLLARQSITTPRMEQTVAKTGCIRVVISTHLKGFVELTMFDPNVTKIICGIKSVQTSSLKGGRYTHQ